MKTVNDISDELRSLGSSLADMSRKMPYSVPEGYFKQLSDKIDGKIGEMRDTEAAAGWGKGLPYSVPVGYFDGLTSAIVSACKAEEPGIALPKKHPFQLPVGYFDSLPAQMLVAAKASEPAKKESLTIPFRRVQPGFVKWAAAAVLVIGLGLGTYKITHRGQYNSPDQILASVPGSEISDYLQHTYRLDVERIVSNNEVSQMEGIESKDIIQYLDETGWDATE